jgi:putative Ca2+/H+ antiporter (TMEM165/GDT1 family)
MRDKHYLKCRRFAMSLQYIVGVAWPFIISVALVTLNEMGDKSQFLAMAFATRMKFRKVMLGIFLAVVVLGGLAVAAGALLASVPGWQGWVRLVSSVLFLVFGVLAFKDEKEDEVKRQKRRKYGDVAAVFTAFFFAEMGDKTQLVTISLAAQYATSPLLILAGTTVGMLFADGLGIFMGVVLNRKLPKQMLKFISAALFIFFGLTGIWESLRSTFYASTGFALIVVVIAAAATLVASYHNYKVGEKRA